MIPPISTVIPFCNKDSHLVNDAIQSILKQTIPSYIYVIGDNVNSNIIGALNKVYEDEKRVYFLRTAKNIGPYCITNSLVKYHLRHKTQYLAIQDADDISYTRRFELQIIGLQENEHCSGPMKHVALPGYAGDRHLKEPTLLCGVKARNIPLGRFINGTRMISLDLFYKLNGFPPIFCSGDICFDNTIQHIGIKTTVTRQILGERRLHPNSLTNHPDTSRDAPLRHLCMEYLYEALREIRKNPSTKTAVKYGGLNEAEPLEELWKK